MIRIFVFRQFVGPERRRLVVGVVLSLVGIAFGLAQPWPLKVIVDDVLLAPAASRPAISLPSVAVPPDWILAGGVVAILVIAGLGAVAGFPATLLLANLARPQTRRRASSRCRPLS